MLSAIPPGGEHKNINIYRIQVYMCFMMVDLAIYHHKAWAKGLESQMTFTSGFSNHRGRLGRMRGVQGRQWARLREGRQRGERILGAVMLIASYLPHPGQTQPYHTSLKSWHKSEETNWRPCSLLTSPRPPDLLFQRIQLSVLHALD